MDVHVRPIIYIFTTTRACVYVHLSLYSYRRWEQLLYTIHLFMLHVCKAGGSTITNSNVGHELESGKWTEKHTSREASTTFTNAEAR